MAAIDYMQDRARALADTECEMNRQLVKWGLQDHEPVEWITILGEEYGEACKGAYEAHFHGQGLDEYREEMTQVAAVALSALENLNRRERGAAEAAA